MRKLLLVFAFAIPQFSFSQEVSPSRVPPTEPPERILNPRGNFEGQTARPLRYWPDGTDFVITNGTEFFNRPLYCVNSAFRVDGGDKPEFSIYLPGRGGNLRFGIKTSGGAKWLNDAEKIVARYRPGSMLYQIRDPLLGKGELHLTVHPLSETKGLIVRAEFLAAGSEGRVTRVPNQIRDSHGLSLPLELIWAFGGASGQKGRRNGDIGCESEPVSQYFQLRPEQCRSNEFSIASNTFVLRSPPATIAGVAPVGTKLAVADATKWNALSGLLASIGAKTELPVIVAQTAIRPEQPLYLALQQIVADSPTYKVEGLPDVLAAAEGNRRAVVEKMVVETPDPFINAAAAALCVAGDGIWDEQQGAFMHGAVAWRNKLLGWRGPYTGDALGWHDRARRHFTCWAGQQITTPIPDTIPPADPTSNLSRNEPALHSNGAMSKSHYDMNLVYIDALFRHLLWTGDLDFAKQLWPVIERHLAWERRLFRREFGPEKLPLYEGYAAIWASDDMGYNGGGATHATAYNHWHNKMAARVAKLISKDGTPYEHEAELILRAMKKHLWLADEGWFAEWKDYLGLQLVHTNAGLWTFYHTIDSEVPTPAEAWRMTRFVDTQIAHIPIHGPGVPQENLFTLPMTSWMPYTWSLNNVVMAEAAHTSLAFWQANRPDAAFSLFKGCVLDSMFMGLCPGNLGMTTRFDMARGEAQRDFADAVGTTSRALIEGLFGVKPDALAGELTIRPGFPARWNKASIRHPDFNFTFSRKGLKEVYFIESKFPKPMALRLQISALRDGIARVTVNGRRVKWRTMDEFIGEPRIEIQSEAAARSEVVVTWKGGAFPLTPALSLGEREKRSPSSGKASVVSGAGDSQRIGRSQLLSTLPGGEGQGEGKASDWNKKSSKSTKLETIPLTAAFNDKVTQIFRNEYVSPRSPFCSLAMPKQGIGSWCHPQEQFEVDDSGLRAAAAAGGGKIVLPNGVPLATPVNADAKNIVFTSQWDNYPCEVSVPLSGKSSHAYLLMAGSTSAMQSRFDNGEVIVNYTDGSSERLALNNPVNWWPIDQDYFIDDYAFRRPEPIPPRVDLKTGKVRLLDVETFKGKGGKIPGGAATVLDLPLNPAKELKSLTVRALANEVVIGLMALTLER